MSRPNTAENFWNRVAIGSVSECWPWLGTKTSSGYGNLAWHSMTVQAHRMAYFLTYGKIELQTNFRKPGVAKRYNKFVLHICDNRMCCNPNHLFLGTMSVNQHDAYDKGRKKQPRGEAHANAKLTNRQAAHIRQRYKAGALQIPLAQEFGVSQRVISLIVRGETYK